MIRELAVMAMWGVPCAMFGTMVAAALARWAVRWNLTTRIILATIASASPVLAVAGIASASMGDFPMSVLSLSPDEFLIPLAIQLVLILVFATPAIWLVSRRMKHESSLQDIFE